MNHTEADVIRETGRLVTRMNDRQTALARMDARARGMYVTEYLRLRLVPRILAKRATS